MRFDHSFKGMFKTQQMSQIYDVNQIRFTKNATLKTDRKTVQNSKGISGFLVDVKQVTTQIELRAKISVLLRIQNSDLILILLHCSAHNWIEN